MAPGAAGEASNDAHATAPGGTRVTRWTIVALAVAFLSGTLLNMALSLQPASAPPDGLLWRGDEASASATTRGRQPRRRVAIVTSNAFGKPAGSGANQLAALRSGPGVLDDHFAASHACYAALHGYDYHMELSTLLEKELGHHQGPVSSYINGYWSKVAAIRKWYYSGLYDWLWWVDYDTLFLNLTRGLEDTLDELEAGGYHLLFPQEHTHSRVFSAFTLLFRRSNVTDRFMELWWGNRYAPSSQVHDDQGAMRPALLELLTDVTGQRGKGIYDNAECGDLGRREQDLYPDGSPKLSNCFLEYLSKLGFGGEYYGSGNSSVTFDNRPPVYFAGFDGSTCDGVFSVQGNSEFASRPDCLHKARLVHTKGEDKFVNEAYARAAPDLLRYECDVHALDAFLQ